jgi:HPt (histidine-containing phosphotransfer) domain-containing protein
MVEVIPEFREVLDLRLREIVEAASASDGLEDGEIRGLLDRFDGWADSAAHLLPRDMPAFSVVVHRLRAGLEQGRSPATVLRRLFRTLSEVNRRLERLDAEPDGGAVPPAAESVETKLPPAIPGATVPVTTGPLMEKPGLRPMSEEEALGFRDFLQEIPDQLRHLEEILLAWDRGETAEALEAYRLFHTIKGVCGFLGLSEFSGLAHACESALSAYREGGRPNPAVVVLLLRVVDLFRDQGQKIRIGLPSR